MIADPFKRDIGVTVVDRQQAVRGISLTLERSRNSPTQVAAQSAAA